MRRRHSLSSRGGWQAAELDAWACLAALRLFPAPGPISITDTPHHAPLFRSPGRACGTFAAAAAAAHHPMLFFHAPLLDAAQASAEAAATSPSCYINTHHVDYSCHPPTVTAHASCQMNVPPCRVTLPHTHSPWLFVVPLPLPRSPFALPSLSSHPSTFQALAESTRLMMPLQKVLGRHTWPLGPQLCGQQRCAVDASKCGRLLVIVNL